MSSSHCLLVAVVRHLVLIWRWGTWQVLTTIIMNKAWMCGKSIKYATCFFCSSFVKISSNMPVLWGAKNQSKKIFLLQNYQQNQIQPADGNICRFSTFWGQFASFALVPHEKIFTHLADSVVTTCGGVLLVCVRVLSLMHVLETELKKQPNMWKSKFRMPQLPSLFSYSD